MGENVLRFCYEMINGSRSVREVNETIIVLIPKMPNSKDMTQFRPVCLCRVLYKIVAKVWANRL